MSSVESAAESVELHVPSTAATNQAPATPAAVVDENGRCSAHPSVRLKKRSVLFGWTTLLEACPECAQGARAEAEANYIRTWENDCDKDYENGDFRNDIFYGQLLCPHAPRPTPTLNERPHLLDMTLSRRYRASQQRANFHRMNR